MIHSGRNVRSIWIGIILVFLAGNMGFGIGRAQEDGIFFWNDFNDDPVGIYTAKQLKAEWNDALIENGISEGQISIVEGSEAREGRSLRVIYQRGKFGPQGGGAQWRMGLKRKYNELYCSYAVKFGAGFDFVKGGKIPGLTGGTGNTGGRIPNRRDDWSARMMWRGEGQVVQYVYHPDQLDMWGQDFFWTMRGQRRFIPGVWHRLEHRIVMNTPGKRNGIIQAWFDGEPALDIRNLGFRDIPDLAIDAFYRTIFDGITGFTELGYRKSFFNWYLIHFIL